MALNLQQLQKQTQRLIMTPQMQQSIQLLQLNAIELEQLAQQELLENPFLTIDEDSPDNPEPEYDRDQIEDRKSNDNEAPDTSDYEPAPEADNVDKSDDGLFDQSSQNGSENDNSDNSSDNSDSPEDFGDGPSVEEIPEQFNEVDLNWDDYYYDAENATYLGGRDSEEEQRDFSEYTPAKTSLIEHLQWQLRCSVLEGQDLEIGEYIIGSINEDGYLAPDIIEDIIQRFGNDRDNAEWILEVVQEFEPTGIAARSLAECLLLQLAVHDEDSPLAHKVLELHFEDFQKKKFREIAKEINADENEISKLYNRICRLEPFPGRSQTKESIHYISPDVYVKIIDGELMIFLNEGNAGSRLSIDRFYRRMMRQQAAALTQEEKDYATEKFRAALTLIKNIEKRKSTILRVTEAIMEVQRPFLDKGVEALRPLTLREIAEMVGMHESTVARVTSRKYVETPQGTFSLKFFFSSSIESSKGEDVSSRAIKDKLRQIISGENPRKPLSDQKIAHMLNEQGFDIARRTVAKYREQLKILPAKYRRQS